MGFKIDMWLTCDAPGCSVRQEVTSSAEARQPEYLGWFSVSWLVEAQGVNSAVLCPAHGLRTLLPQQKKEG